jgi:biotin synthase
MDMLRSNWTHQEISALFELPLPELIFQAASSHRQHHAVSTVQLSMPLSVKVGGGLIVGVGETRGERVGFILALAAQSPHPESVAVSAVAPGRCAALTDPQAARIDDIEVARTVAVVRITMPRSMISLSDGRDGMSELAQTLCFLAGANAICIGDTLQSAGDAGETPDAVLFNKLGLVAMAAGEPKLEWIEAMGIA